MTKCSYLKFRAKKFPDGCEKIELSNISAGKSFRKKIAHPRACEEKLAKKHFPPHSDLTSFSISFEIRESEISNISGIFFFIALKNFCLFGVLPIEFGLKLNILKDEAELS